MADEVSKKDLQALASKVDKQIADLGRQNNSASLSKQITETGKRIDELRREKNKDLAEENATAVTIRQDVMKRIDELEKRIGDLEKKGR